MIYFKFLAFDLQTLFTRIFSSQSISEQFSKQNTTSEVNQISLSSNTKREEKHMSIMINFSTGVRNVGRSKNLGGGGPSIKEVMKCLLNGRFWFYSGKTGGEQSVG